MPSVRTAAATRQATRIVALSMAVLFVPMFALLAIGS
jgi:hypothetical protein